MIDRYTDYMNFEVNENEVIKNITLLYDETLTLFVSFHTFDKNNDFVDEYTLKQIDDVVKSKNLIHPSLNY